MIERPRRPAAARRRRHHCGHRAHHVARGVHPRHARLPGFVDDDLQAAPAYWGIVDPSKLPARPADVLAPRIAGVTTIQKQTTSRFGTTVRYTRPSAIDTRDGKVQLRCTPGSGSRFPVGTTKVTCTAKDRAGNVRTLTFDVVVTRKAS